MPTDFSGEVPDLSPHGSLQQIMHTAIPYDPDLRRQTWFIIVFNGLMLAWIVFRPAHHAVHVAVDDTLESLGPLLMPFWCLLALLHRRRKQSGAEANSRVCVPLFLSLGAFCYGVGQAAWTYLEVVRRQVCPFPSIADAGYLTAYPFLFLGVLLLPLRPAPGALRGRVLLDGLMTMTALVTFSWYFLLGPTVLAGDNTLLAKVLGAGYPLADLVLLFCVLMLSAHTDEPAVRPLIRTLSLGLIAIVAADTIFGYEGLHNTYASGGIIDVLWPIGYMLVVLAGGMAARLPRQERTRPEEERAMRSISATNRETQINPILWRSWLPYLLVPMVGALLWYTLHRHGDEKLEAGVYIGSAALIGLILIRQVFAILENGHLNQYLRDAYTELEIKNRTLAAANARLEGLAITDGLTGLKNHRAFQEQLETECRRSARYGTPLSLVLLDVDHFKQYNDTFGHPAGDEVLKLVSQALLDNARDSDFVARYGGEEFVILLPSTESEAAQYVSERFRAAIEAARWPKRPVTASFGVATTTPRMLSGTDLLAQADQALYRAKRLGRNCVCQDPAAPECIPQDDRRAAAA